MADKDYTTIGGRKACETVIKGSRFIGIAVPVSDLDDIREAISSVEKEFPNATHYCYGAVYGGSDRSERGSDNGEPSGTAARPIIDVIRKSGLTDTAVIVVRYFGGTLLGTGGLTHAYSSSAATVISMCEKVERRVCGIVSLSVSYGEYDRFNRYLLNYFSPTPDVSFDTAVSIEGPIPKDRVDDFLDALKDAFGDRYRAEVKGYGYR